MKYLLDTVTVVRHFSNSGYIGKNARKVLSMPENEFAISVVTLMEILYLSEKKRIKVNFNQTIDLIESHPLFHVVDLNSEILKVAAAIRFKELHDRLIIATAKWLKAPMITSDRQIQKLNIVDVIWD